MSVHSNKQGNRVAVKDEVNKAAMKTTENFKIKGQFTLQRQTPTNKLAIGFMIL